MSRMRSTLRVAIAPLLLLVLSATKAPPHRAEPSSVAGRGVSEDGVTVFFSPEGGCLQAVVALIDGAKKTLDVQAYLLTTEKIAGPIAKAHKRGVKVRVIMDADKVGQQYSGATYLTNAGVPVTLDAEHKEAHNKLMLIDGRTVITGSFNFTLAAEKENAENLVILENKPRLFAAYQKNFETHLRHSKAYQARSR
jgi:phosphatidylserine/phosphatidylglycerophosphate/cardiolipin synthase-like enzyme